MVTWHVGKPCTVWHFMEQMFILKSWSLSFKQSLGLSSNISKERTQKPTECNGKISGGCLRSYVLTPAEPSKCMYLKNININIMGFSVSLVESNSCHPCSPCSSMNHYPPTSYPSWPYGCPSFPVLFPILPSASNSLRPSSLAYLWGEELLQASDGMWPG